DRREFGSYLVPRPKYFAALARKIKDPAGVAFFRDYERTFPDSAGGLWPAWIRPQTDESGCTRYGSLALVAAYRRWTTYRAGFRGRFAGEVRGILAQVESELTAGTCPCEGKPEVLRELERFVEEFPDA